MTRTYKLYFANHADLTKTARSRREALAIARNVLGVDRVYQGSQYSTDTDADANGDRPMVEALDLWVSRANAKREMGASADCVVTW